MNWAEIDTRLHSEGGIEEQEVLIPDMRNRQTPAEMVERKLVSLSRGLPLPVSQLHASQLQRRSR
jgi:hypothetical protein